MSYVFENVRIIIGGLSELKAKLTLDSWYTLLWMSFMGGSGMR
jgi:hypothetical protein